LPSVSAVSLNVHLRVVEAVLGLALFPGLATAHPLVSGGLGTLRAAPVCATTTAVVGPAAARGDIMSVGITYFAGRSRSGDDDHLAAALTSEVASQLLSARMPSVVGPRGGSSRGLLTVKLSEGGAFADVQLSITGTVFRVDTLLFTTVRVNRTRDGSLIWSGTRSRPILDLPILAQLIAEEVATRLGAQLTTPSARRVTEKSTAVYELILRGNHPHSRYSPEALVSAIDYFDQALSLDRGSVRARELRETAELRLLAWGGSGSDAEARLIERGLLRRVLDRDRDESERLVDEADAELRDGQYDHACKLLNAAIDNDARSAPAYALRALIRAHAGQVREAFGDAEVVTQLGRPRWGNTLRAITLQRMGDVAGAKREVRRLVAAARHQRGALSFWDARMLATALVQTGDAAGAQAVLARINPADPRTRWLRTDPSLQPSARPGAAPRRQ
jgi:tetratricopeptide (TPR) repeat protein